MPRITAEMRGIAKEHQLAAIYHDLTNTNNLALAVDEYVSLKQDLLKPGFTPEPGDKKWILNPGRTFGFKRLYDLQFEEGRLSASLGQLVQEVDEGHDVNLTLCFKPQRGAQYFFVNKYMLPKEDIEGSLTQYWQDKLISILSLDAEHIAENVPSHDDFVIVIQGQDDSMVKYSVYLKIPDNDGLYFHQLLRNWQVKDLSK